MASPDVLIAAFRDYNVGAFDLAEAVSFAVRIEPYLLRRMRLELLPNLDAGAEADVWLSPLMQVRSPEGALFYPEIAAALRRHLAEHDPIRYWQAWELMERMHQHLPATVQLEERIVFLSSSGHPDALEEVDQLLQRAAKTLVTSEKRVGIANWAARALPRFPEDVRNLEGANILASASYLRLTQHLPLGELNQEMPPWMSWILPTGTSDAQVRVRLLPDGIELTLGETGSNKIEVPDIEPSLVEISWKAEDGREEREQVPLQRGQPCLIETPSRSFDIRTVHGKRYRLTKKRPIAERKTGIEESEVTTKQKTGIQDSNITTIRNENKDRAVVFLHGFTGSRDDTWDRFPGLLGIAIGNWDIFTVGYATTMLPDVVGVWSADPDLPILSTMLCTQMQVPPFHNYKSLALIGHSMGGLIIQKALVQDPQLAKRVSHVLLYGTPSGGLSKANSIFFWKRQLKNMAADSSFITDLRADWKRLYGADAPFKLLVVAGASDQFVPPASSLEPFDPKVQRVVMGDHLSMVKPNDISAPTIALAAAALSAESTPAPDTASELRLAAERPMAGVTDLIEKAETSQGEMSAKMIVDAALALEKAGKRPDAIALLERHQEQDTDIKATYGGRLKRIWLETNQNEYAERALAQYEGALKSANDPEQIYYYAINIAFMKFVYSDDVAAAQSMATLALQYAAPSGNDVWKTATVAEANLYFGRIEESLKEYRKLLTLGAEIWKLQSASLQAGRIAAKLNNRVLTEELEAIFTPGAKRVNRIFLSYSHKDKEWVDRLKVMIAPYLRAAESELDLWDDSRLQAGQQWDVEIHHALAEAGVGVALVSASFLGSEYVVDKQLPAMIKAADEEGLRLLWVYISAAGWEETPLKRFQATHDTKKPLNALPGREQDEILKSVAQQIKEAALGATSRFKNQPNGETRTEASAKGLQ
jgi:pimeloyl-ACP methyl ester carboxylesterase